MSDEHDDRRELEDLLPWFATGTLSRAEAQRVEAALARNPALSNRLSIVRDEMMGTIQLNESLGSPSARAMQQLLAKVDAEPARSRTSVLGLSSRIAAFTASLSPRTLLAVATAAAIVIVAQSTLIGVGLLRGEAGRYLTASAPTPEVTSGSFVLVRFMPEASAAKITAFLESSQAVIVSGPSGGGFYRLRVSQAVLTKDALSAIVQRMQRDPSISFVAATEQ